MTLTHRKCGGEVREDLTLRYDSFDEETQHHRVDYGFRCVRCKREISGDRELESPEEKLEYPLDKRASRR